MALLPVNETNALRTIVNGVVFVPRVLRAPRKDDLSEVGPDGANIRRQVASVQ